MMRFFKTLALFVAVFGILVAAVVYNASWYYTSQHGQGCASCHEMAQYVSAVHGSAHRSATCMDCHEAGLATKLRHIRVHLSRNPPESIRLRDVDVLAMTTKCQACHQHEYASRHAGPHGATYSEIFANPTHNTERRLMDDCLRCHGMHFNGAIRDLVQPQNTAGPWHITRASFADQPTMPCMACHEMHREGDVQSKPATRIAATLSPTADSLAIFDRREQMHFSVRLLSLPQLSDGPRPVKISPDQRHASATNATHLASRKPPPSPPQITGVRRPAPATTERRLVSTKASAASPAMPATTKAQQPPARHAIPRCLTAASMSKKWTRPSPAPKAPTTSTGSVAPTATSTAFQR